MIRIVTFALAAAVSTAALAGGQAGAAPQAQPLTRAAFLQAISGNFTAMDTNKDGQLSKLEIEAAEAKNQAQLQAKLSQRRDAAFAKLDTNKDGQISKAEWQAGAPIPQLPKPDATKVLSRLDKNSDQKVSLAEYQAGPSADFDKLDKNKDGVLSVQERASARPAKNK